MKKIYWFIFSTLLCACGQGDPSVDGVREEAKETDGWQEVPIARGAETVLTRDSLLNRFAPSWDVEEVLSKLPDAAIKKREAVQNRHNPTQIDTLLSIGNGRSEVRFYRLPEQDLLQGATIKDPGLSFGEELGVGKPAGALSQQMPPLSGKDTLPEHIVLEGELVPRSLKIRLGKGVVQQLEYQGYVD